MNQKSQREVKTVALSGISEDILKDATEAIVNYFEGTNWDVLVVDEQPSRVPVMRDSFYYERLAQTRLNAVNRARAQAKDAKKNTLILCNHGVNEAQVQLGPAEYLDFIHYKLRRESKEDILKLYDAVVFYDDNSDEIRVQSSHDDKKKSGTRKTKRQQNQQLYSSWFGHDQVYRYDAKDQNGHFRQAQMLADLSELLKLAL